MIWLLTIAIMLAIPAFFSLPFFYFDANGIPGWLKEDDSDGAVLATMWFWLILGIVACLITLFVLMCYLIALGILS